MSVQLSEHIDMAAVYLEKLNLAEDTIKDYRQSAFRPLERRLAGQGCVDSELFRNESPKNISQEYTKLSVPLLWSSLSIITETKSL